MKPKTVTTNIVSLLIGGALAVTMTASGEEKITVIDDGRIDKDDLQVVVERQVTVTSTSSPNQIRKQIQAVRIVRNNMRDSCNARIDSMNLAMDTLKADLDKIQPEVDKLK